jgi:hypothetical protein
MARTGGPESYVAPTISRSVELGLVATMIRYWLHLGRVWVTRGEIGMQHSDAVELDPLEGLALRAYDLGSCW